MFLSDFSSFYKVVLNQYLMIWKRNCKLS